MAPSISWAKAMYGAVMSVPATIAARISFNMVRPSHRTAGTHIIMVNPVWPVFYLWTLGPGALFFAVSKHKAAIGQAGAAPRLPEASCVRACISILSSVFAQA